MSNEFRLTRLISKIFLFNFTLFVFVIELILTN